MVHHKRLGTGLSEGSPCGPTASLIQAEALIMGCRPNKLTHALYCELAMLNRREDVRPPRPSHLTPQILNPGSSAVLWSLGCQAVIAQWTLAGCQLPAPVWAGAGQLAMLAGLGCLEQWCAVPAQQLADAALVQL